MYRLSNRGFCSSIRLHRILVRFCKKMFRRATGTGRFWATRPVGILFCPAPLCPDAPPCEAPTRTARGMFGFWARQLIRQRLNRIL